MISRDSKNGYLCRQRIQQVNEKMFDKYRKKNLHILKEKKKKHDFV
jgi:hypothetical protein